MSEQVQTVSVSFKLSSTLYPHCIHTVSTLIVSQSIGKLPHSVYSVYIYIKLIELNYYVVVELIVESR